MVYVTTRLAACVNSSAFNLSFIGQITNLSISRLDKFQIRTLSKSRLYSYFRP